jgi:hypothetical protein
VLGREALKDLPDGKLIEKPEEFEAALVEFLAARFP